MKRLLMAALIVLALGALGDRVYAQIVLDGHVYYSEPPDMTVGAGKTVRCYFSPSYYITDVTNDDGLYEFPFDEETFVDSVWCKFEDDTAIWCGQYDIEEVIQGHKHVDFWVYPMWKPKK